MYYIMPSVLNCMWQVRDRVTAIMCCLGKIAKLGVFLTWNVRLPPRGPGWDLLYDMQSTGLDVLYNKCESSHL